MRIFIALIWCMILSAACADDPLPNSPGGPTPPGRGGADARADADLGPPPPTLEGRLCVINDLSDRAPCRPLLSSGLSVSTLATFSFAADDGSFSVDNPGYADQMALVVLSTDDWMGSTSLIQLDADGTATGVELPVLAKATLESTLVASSASQLPGSALVAVRVDTSGGAPAAGVAFAPLNGIEPSYDTGVSGVFAAGSATNESGTAVYFDLDPTLAGYDITFADGAGTQTIRGAAFTATLVLLDATLQ